MFQIKTITPEETTHLRQLTLRQHQEEKDLIYPGDHDEETMHYGAFEDSELVGIASIYKVKMKDVDEPESWRLRGMATTENVRGKGYGKDLMNKCLGHIKSKNGKLFWCNARITAEGFYEKFGMKRKGEVFHPEDLGPHVVMWMEM
ncbi:MAG: GNAT family N-acetyltransferase [Ignavibacteria bacterium]|nr:GNAT family N-acetyltransferase [Ignavibacteria bacterium]